jgi:hypothetical protein
VLVFTALIGISGFLLTGCGGSKAKADKTPMELKDVPPEIMKIAKEQLPGVTFEEANREANGNYELRGKAKNGKVREIDIKPDGTVAEID